MSLILMFNIQQQALKTLILNARRTGDFSQTRFNATSTTSVAMELQKNFYAQMV